LGNKRGDDKEGAFALERICDIWSNECA
jgi:hypothetical protein